MRTVFYKCISIIIRRIQTCQNQMTAFNVANQHQFIIKDRCRPSCILFRGAPPLISVIKWRLKTAVKTLATKLANYQEKGHMNNHSDLIRLATEVKVEVQNIACAMSTSTNHAKCPAKDVS